MDAGRGHSGSSGGAQKCGCVMQADGNIHSVRLPDDRGSVRNCSDANGVGESTVEEINRKYAVHGNGYVKGFSEFYEEMQKREEEE